MCGIFILAAKNLSKFDLNKCKTSLKVLEKRGPDKTFYKTHQNRIFYGQTILSLTGNVTNQQELQSNNSYELLFNGEIYNYIDLSKKHLQNFNIDKNTTDTEVLLSLHNNLLAENIPSLLDGMFAYCLHDKNNNILHLVTDIQGEKSLYYYQDNDLVIISSEINAILEYCPNQKINKECLNNYFFTRHFMSYDMTPYKRIRKLLPGSYEKLNLNNFEIKKSKYQEINDYIDPNLMEENKNLTNDELAEELDSIIKRNIKSMTPVNRKFASVFSGGIDSSLISYYLNKNIPPDILIAVNHLGKDQISNNLKEFEKILNRKIEVINIDKEFYASKIKECQQTLASPLLSHSVVGQMILSSKVKELSCKVIFGGEGGDEVFGGYDAYSNEFNNNLKFSPSPYTSFIESNLKFNDLNIENIKCHLRNIWQDSLDAYKHVENKDEQLIHSMIFCDLKYQLSEVGLRSSDLMSMMWSVEPRSLFVRKDILKFALNLPIKSKIDKTNINPNLRTKILLKKIFLKYFPEKLLFNKQGFSGFPNESGEFLGEIDKFNIFSFLNIKKPKDLKDLNKAIIWKLINLEYYLNNLSIK
tara:strand:- start:1542 stop:3296 length:1755 start_codon:yes stop_codon:yes gene_type:complete